MASTENESNLTEVFRERFIEARKRRALSQEDVAVLLDVDQQIVSNFERGKRRLSLDDMPRWARAVGNDWRDMLRTEQDRTTLKALREELKLCEGAIQDGESKTREWARHVADARAELELRENAYNHTVQITQQVRARQAELKQLIAERGK